MISSFDCDNVSPIQEILSGQVSYNEDRHPSKVNLITGVYQTDALKPWALPVVRKTEVEIVARNDQGRKYANPLGVPEFTQSATKLLLGTDNKAIAEQRAFGIQCLSGTGALMIGTKYLKMYRELNTIYISAPPNYANHNWSLTLSGFESIKTYRYWDGPNRQLDFKGMIEDLRNAPNNAVVVLQACAHNPIGIDPNDVKWIAIADVIVERNLLPFFDIAYQGFASGDLNRDSHAIRYFVDRGIDVFCAQSFSKNFGLYDERIGNLTIVVKDFSTVAQIKSDITSLVMGLYLNPPAHGARVVARILNDRVLYEEWRECLKTMSTRMQTMRKALRENIERLNTPGKWSHITEGIGMFTLSGFTVQQVAYVKERYHIYMLSDGRISLSGINAKNVEYVAKAISDSVNKFPEII